MKNVCFHCFLFSFWYNLVDGNPPNSQVKSNNICFREIYIYCVFVIVHVFIFMYIYVCMNIYIYK